MAFIPPAIAAGVAAAPTIINTALGAVALGKMGWEAGKAAKPYLGRAVNSILHSGKAKSAAKYMKGLLSKKYGGDVAEHLKFISRGGKESLKKLSQLPSDASGSAMKAIHGGSVPSEFINHHGPMVGHMKRPLRIDDDAGKGGGFVNHHGPMVGNHLKPYIDAMGAKLTKRPQSFHSAIEHLNRGKVTDGLDAYNRTFYGNMV